MYYLSVVCDRTPRRMQSTILLVDDDDGFLALVQRAIRQSQLDASLQYVCDGEEAISYLSHQGRFKDQTAFPRPWLVLLDLHMPRVDGFEVLQWKLNHPELNKMPFVILSSSGLEKDKKRASELGARDYLMKPMELPRLLEMVENLDRFWTSVNIFDQIFLRDSETGEFYKNPDSWVANPDEATVFETPDDALRQRSSITKSKLEMLMLDKGGRPRAGLRLWSDAR